MLQRILHVLRGNYALAVFWIYVAAFVVAFLSIFVFPPLALGMVFVGIFALVPAVLLGMAIRAAARAATRPYLRKGICPLCRQERAVALEPGELTCVACGSRFAVNGEELPAS